MKFNYNNQLERTQTYPGDRRTLSHSRARTHTYTYAERATRTTLVLCDVCHGYDSNINWTDFPLP